MARAAVRLSLFGLLLAAVAALPVKDNWDIYSYHINSTVTSRYATTVITSRVANRMGESKEIEFHVRIPKNAFISKFKMVIDGQEYDGIVKEKEKAQQQYSQAVSRGQSAGIVSSVGRTLEEFKTSVTVAAHKKVTFELTYEELLKRRLGNYELQIHARPMQPVKDFKVDVYIHENAGINSLMVKGGLSTNALGEAITTTKSEKQAWVFFYPTVDQQKSCNSCDNNGMNGDLVIVYDVKRDVSLGDIKRSTNYFVHHFAPSGLSHIPKNVVFIIDQSGSMHGKKIQQTRIALIHILNDLAEEDFFGLITFDSQVFQWKRELVQATEGNLESARRFARNIKDNGATDINAAVLKGAEMLNAYPRPGSASLLILLTDGDPTTGETNLEVIQSNVRKAIAEKFPLYCLGFGFDVNFEFLEKMSLQNNGVARRIYEDSDADLQLKGFYKEVATPLLTSVTMVYIGGTNLTMTNFSHYYNGSEIVVAGQISDNDVTFAPQVLAISRDGSMVFADINVTAEASGMVSDSQMQRVWAYLTVKQLLDKELRLSGSEKEEATKEALELSLKYGFVTPLTSMVVTKPQGEDTDVLNKPKEGGPDTTSTRGLGMNPGPAGFPGASYGGRFLGSPYRYFDAVNSQRPPRPFPGYYPISQPPPPALPGLVHGVMSGQDYALPGLKADVAYDADYEDIGMGPFLTEIPPTEVTAQIPFYRFMRKSTDGSFPICFDLPGLILKLLHHPNIELVVNGQLSVEAQRGFSKIVIQYKADHRIEVDPREIIVRAGQTETRHSGGDLITVGSVTLIKRDKEVDIAVGDTRIIILIHQHAGREFLWPVLRQRPSDSSITGILTLQPVAYEEQQQQPKKLKIEGLGMPVKVTREKITDFSVPLAPVLECWYMSASEALQTPLDQLTVPAL